MVLSRTIVRLVDSVVCGVYLICFQETVKIKEVAKEASPSVSRESVPSGDLVGKGEPKVCQCCGDVYINLCVQVDASVSVNPVEFGSTDARLRGLCGGKSGVKQKSGPKLATNFATPLTPVPSRSSASESEGKKPVKGEKSKIKKRTSPPITPVVDGATGGCEGN